MPHDAIEPQDEPRTAQVNVRLTPSEKLDVQLVAAFDRIPESEVLRTHTIEAVKDRAANIRARQGAVA
jgi:hypothetical protein